MRGLRALMAACGIGLAGPVLSDPIHVPYRATFAGIEIGMSALIDRGHRRSLSAFARRPRERGRERTCRARQGACHRQHPAHASWRRTISAPPWRRAGARPALRSVSPRVRWRWWRCCRRRPEARAAPGRSLGESRGLIDPLSALVIPAARANLAPLSVCGRTQRVFDGLRRYDIHMFPSRMEHIVGRRPNSCGARLLGGVANRCDCITASGALAAAYAARTAGIGLARADSQRPPAGAGADRSRPAFRYAHFGGGRRKRLRHRAARGFAAIDIIPAGRRSAAGPRRAPWRRPPPH